ncbi:MAG: hypothetical protein JSS66_02165 [Armatimonadetes bacterium]|nr:hypothetical protein [Armatimonadota bacterium]
MENLAEILTLIGMGGLAGAVAGAMVAGKRLASHLADFATTVEQVLKDPRHADLSAVVKQARTVEQDLKSLLGVLKQVFKG